AMPIPTDVADPEQVEHAAQALEDRFGEIDAWCRLVNTPQFNWCRSKLPKHPQPVPPIFQPEVPAEAIYYAAHHRRREIYVGASTAQAILGNKLSPGFAHWYLAKTGFTSQQIQDQPWRPRWPRRDGGAVPARWNRDAATGRAPVYEPDQMAGWLTNRLLGSRLPRRQWAATSQRCNRSTGSPPRSGAHRSVGPSRHIGSADSEPNRQDLPPDR
ncbi:MAG: hypothetical protein M3072_05880, partial [Candidatus Dormibacteraeota bacterium]|nr:hypothetical protein [Candidatus Dormibacteraeota bacterium]